MNIKLLVFSVAAIVGSSICLSFSHAEIVNTSADLLSNKKTLDYVYSIPLIKIMYRFGVEQDRKFGLQSDCKSQYLTKPDSMMVLSPIDFPDDKQNPTKGVWNARYQLERCGESKLYNVLFVADKNGEAPTPHANYPGSTIGNPILVNDAMPTAIAVGLARSGVKDCKGKDIDFFDMRVSEPIHDVVEGDKTIKGVWNEIWTFRACGQMIDIEMTFVPNAKRGGISFFTTPEKVGKVSAKP